MRRNDSELEDLEDSCVRMSFEEFDLCEIFVFRVVSGSVRSCYSNIERKSEFDRLIFIIRF